MKRLTVYCSGICGPENPGGVGVVSFSVYRGKREIHSESAVIGAGAGMTVMVVEYAAAIRALEWISANHRNSDVTVRSDSQRLINQLSGKWKVYNPQLASFLKHVRLVEENLPPVRYVIVSKRDAAMRKTKSKTRTTFEEFFARAKAETAKAPSGKVSMKDVDSEAVEKLAAEFFRYAQNYPDPRIPYLAVEVLHTLFESGFLNHRYQLGEIKDVATAAEMAERIVRPYIILPKQVKKVRKLSREPKPARREELEHIYG